MAETLLSPFGRSLIASTAFTATTTSAVLTLPLADSYSFILDVTAVSGTSVTMDVAIQITPDNTTYYSVLRFAQVTAISQQRITVQPIQGRGEAGSQATLADTGGAANANQPMSQNIKVKFTMAGTSPSFTCVLWAIGQPRATAV